MRRGALLLAVALPACSGGPAGPAGPPPSVRPLGSVLPAATRICDGLECRDVTVSCPGVREPAAATLHVRPVDGPILGTVLFFSGGNGTGLLSDDPPGLAAQVELAASGFRVIEVRWRDPWIFGTSADEGHLALACRPATLTRWIHDEPGIHGADRPFCVMGNSNGAAQVAYGLSHYGLEGIIDLAIPSEGPPMGRIDLGCDRTNPLFEPFWYPLSAAAQMDRGFGFSADGPCESSDPAFSPRFRAASVVNETGDYRHPSTRVHFLMGGLSDSPAQPHGLTWHTRLSQEGATEVALDFVPGVGHSIMVTPAGANAVRDVVLAECRPR